MAVNNAGDVKRVFAGLTLEAHQSEFGDWRVKDAEGKVVARVYGKDKAELAKFFAGAAEIVRILKEERERLQEICAERDEFTELFEVRRDADRRAIVRWQEATGRKAVLPDHADLCVWLLNEVQRVYEITVAEREKAAVVQSIADEMIQRVAELEAERDAARAEAQAGELAAIRRFVEQVNARAEEKMLKTHKLEGSHFAAMTQLLKEMEARTK